uniref:CCHC-type domain-containing protein n=1 Tax=Caenorhabditis japonica TaxID=281687 RepID=A0A8R1IMS0_CAEJA
MTSTTKFVIEHELEDENGQDGGHKNGFIDDKTLDVEMDCDNLEREHEARKREDEARLKRIEQELRTYGKVAPNEAKRMIEPIRERFSQREKLIVEKENKIVELHHENQELKTKLRDLQENELFDSTSDNKDVKAIQEFMMMNGITTVKDIEDILDECSKNRQNLIETKELLQITMREENNLSGRLLKLRAQNTELLRKIDIESMKRSLEQVDMKLNAERLKKESEKVAYEENCCQHTGNFSPHRLLQNCSREICSLQEVQVDRIEKPRGRDQGTDQIFEEGLDSVGTQESGFYGKKGLPVQTELSLLSQLYLEQNLPEPPKYTAEKDSVGIGAFERTFAMKFGRLSTEQQVTLLETKYLAGKALKAFRGLVEMEKDSVRSILRALANRLRISVEDETRRAKTRWETLRIAENQSVEDYCLLLDEVAKIAYRRLPPEELSSLKTAKLLGAIAGNEALQCMIDAKLLEYPEKEHYDICRLLAIRHAMSLKDFRDKREVRNERDGKMVTLDREVRNFSNLLPNRQSFPKVAVQCFKCGVYGHTARICPILAKAPVQRNALKEPNLKVESIDIKISDVQQGKRGKKDVVRGRKMIEKGKIGSADVDFVIDSGSCISLMSMKTWSRILKINGVGWKKKVRKEKSDLRTVFTAANEPIKLIEKVSVETAMRTRTRRLTFYVAAVDRETIILGTGGFKAMGIQLKIDEPSRDVRIVDEVKLDRHGQKIVEIFVEGIIHEERRLCLITPTSKCLTAGVFQVSSEGKARIKIANHMSESIFLRKGQKIATGELNGFEVLNKRPELLGKLNKWLRDTEDTKPHKPTVCEVRREVQFGGRHPKGPLEKDGEDAVGNVHSDADSRFGLAHGRKNGRKFVKKNVSTGEKDHKRRSKEELNGTRREQHAQPANRTFMRPRSCLVRNTFGEKYTNQPVDTLLVMAPGVSENAVPLAFTEKLILKRAQSAEKMLQKQFNKKRYTRMIMIIPFATDNGYVDQWSRLIKVVPGSTKILLIPAPTSIHDFSLAGAFISLVASVKRSRGELDVISPGDRVMAHKNQRLVDLGDQMNSFDYWHVVNKVIRVRDLVWQQ